MAAGQHDLAGDPARALQQLDDVLQQGEAADDLMVTSFAHLVRACVLARAGELAGADVAVSAAEQAMVRMRQPWWDAAMLRLRAAVTALGPGGWPRAGTALARGRRPGRERGRRRRAGDRAAHGRVRRPARR